MNLRRLLTLYLFLIGFGANADENHYDEILIGDRAAGMAGAYAAIADDTAGLYYNPAGIVYAVDSNISGSMNAFNIATKSYKDVVGPGRDWNRVSSELLPNFFGIIQDFGGGKAGFSYAVVDSTQENQDDVFQNAQLPSGSVDEYVINFNNQDKTIHIGPAYAKRINDRLSIGTSLFLHYRQQERITHIFTDSAATTPNLDSTEYASTTEFGLRPGVGIMFTPREKLSFGFKIAKSFLLSSDYVYQKSGPDSTSGVDYNFRQAAEKKDKREYPWVIRSSAAYFFDKRFIVAGALNYFSATSDSQLGDRNAVVNLSAGAEYYLRDNLALRGGVYTNNATTPKLSANKLGQYEHIDYIGVTASVTRFSRSNALTFGLQYAAGSGKAQLFAEPILQSVDASVFNVFMSASYSY